MTRRPKAQRAPILLFTRTDQKAQVDVPARHVLLLMSRDRPPEVALTEPGTYEMDLQALGTGPAVLPVAAVVIPQAHARAWLAMTPAQVNAVLDSALRQQPPPATRH